NGGATGTGIRRTYNSNVTNSDIQNPDIKNTGFGNELKKYRQEHRVFPTQSTCAFYQPSPNGTAAKYWRNVFVVPDTTVCGDLGKPTVTHSYACAFYYRRLFVYLGHRR